MSFNNSISNHILDNIPIAYLFTSIVYDQNKEPVDYKVLSVNKAFEEDFGISDHEVCDVNMSQSILLTETERYYWLNALKTVVPGKKTEFDRLFLYKKHWFLVTAYIPYPGHMAIFLHHSRRLRAARHRFNESINESMISQSFAQSIFDNSPVAIIVYKVLRNGMTGNDFIIQKINRKCAEVEGWNEKDIVGVALGTARPGVEQFGILPIFRQVWIDGKMTHYPAKRYVEQDRVRWFDNTIFRLPTGQVVSLYTDITETKAREERILYLSYHDALTGLYNRVYMEEMLSSDAFDNSFPIFFFIADIDGLMFFNNVYGLKTGDKVLIETANTIKSLLPESAVVCRWGGDEFIAVLLNTDLVEGEKICANIIKTINEKTVEDTALSISIGYTVKTDKNMHWNEVLDIVQEYMHKSKMLGAKSHRSNIIASINKTLYEKSQETEEHGERLAYYCKKIGAELNLSSSQLDDIVLFSMLHDIGKITVDESILNKPGKLDEREMDIIRQHPEKGYRIATTMPEFSNVAEYILTHHERWDGTGYPSGLKGENIPLLSRILSVADAYDVIISGRPYQKARSVKEAMQELKRCSGTQFDPQIVDIFVNIIENEEMLKA